ncbi:MAG: hypothetical protein L3J30_14000 [Marinosulfonomonas sp.]|nr:hypothetical protein [Marinosulfonomonas sp.]
MTTQKIIVTVQDLRAARLCFQGSRPWLARHGLSWQDFLANGIEAETLEATGDALAKRVISQARARMAREVRLAGENNCDG